MPMTFREQVAVVTLGLMPGDRLPEVAAAPLIEGYDCPSLAALAGQPPRRYDPWESQRLWDKALEELRLAAPTPVEAAKLLVRAYARLLARGELAPRQAAAMVVEVHDAVREGPPDARYVGDSIGAERIIGFFYQLDDSSDEAVKRQIEGEIAIEFQRVANEPAV